jgi:methionyl-tRNA formyltransferase
MRAVFCGTPEFAVPSLEDLFDAGIEIPLVVSQPDRVRGRRGRPTPSPVRARAIDLGLDTAVLEKGQRDRLYAVILSTRPDVVVVVAFGHIIREPLLTGAPLGCVNVHASLLPRWRGPAPIHTAIVAGDEETGVCTMKLAAGVDTGDVYECARTPIGPDETAQQLHDRLAAIGARTLVSTLRGLDAGTLEARPQPEEGITHAPMLERGEGSVDFDRPARRVHDRVRGLSPWPAVAVMWEGQRLKLSGSTLVDAGGPAGEILAVEEEGIVVGCRTGAVRIGQVQAEGKRAMSGAEFARGHAMRAGQKFEPVEGFAPREPRW